MTTKEKDRYVLFLESVCEKHATIIFHVTWYDKYSESRFGNYESFDHVTQKVAIDFLNNNYKKLRRVSNFMILLRDKAMRGRWVSYYRWKRENKQIWKTVEVQKTL